MKMIFIVISVTSRGLNCRSIVSGTTKEINNKRTEEPSASILVHHATVPQLDDPYLHSFPNEPPPVSEVEPLNDYGHEHIGPTQHHSPHPGAELSALAHLKHLLEANPLLAAAVLSTTLGLSGPHAAPGQNHPQHLAPNPYVALLLSHYGRHIALPGAAYRSGRGLYGYNAANNLHNNQPFGAYKIYKDIDV